VNAVDRKPFAEISYPLLHRMLHGSDEDMIIADEDRAEFVAMLRSCFYLDRVQNALIDDGCQIIGAKTIQGKTIGFFGGRYWRLKPVVRRYVPE
jgi:hypothetical protein